MNEALRREAQGLVLKLFMGGASQFSIKDMTRLLRILELETIYPEDLPSPQLLEVAQ